MDFGLTLTYVVMTVQGEMPPFLAVAVSLSVALEEIKIKLSYSIHISMWHLLRSCQIKFK